MTPQKKCVSLETARRLKAEGFTQYTERYWKSDGGWHLSVKRGVHSVAAPDATEIGELLPQFLQSSDRRLWISTDRTTKKRWECTVESYKNGEDRKNIFIGRSDNEAEARAQVWLYLKENNLL